MEMIKPVSITSQKLYNQKETSSETDISPDTVRLSGSKDSFLDPMKDLREQLMKIAASGEAISSPSLKSGFISGYMDAKQIDERVMKIADEYPDLVNVVTRDYCTCGYDGKESALRGPSPLRYVTVNNGKNDENKTGVLLMASPHGREKMNPLVMVEILEELCANYKPGCNDPKIKEITDLIDSLNIYIVPVTNPDGLNFAVHDDTMWRKTRSHINGSQSIGVDINRNYGYLWEPGNPQTECYPGSAPFSEPETRNVASITDEHQEIKFACDFHSKGEEVRIPTGVNDSEDIETFKTIQSRMIDAIGEPQGKKYKPVFSDVINGASDDYLYHEKGIFTIVLEDGNAISPSVDEALNVVKGVAAGAMELLRIAKEMNEKKQAENLLPAA